MRRFLFLIALGVPLLGAFSAARAERARDRSLWQHPERWRDRLRMASNQPSQPRQSRQQQNVQAGTPIPVKPVQNLADLQRTNRPSLLGYRRAREVLFGIIENQGGIVTDVYLGRRVATRGVPDAGGTTQLNTEHVVPQSVLKSWGIKYARSDLHNLLPTDTGANGVRGHFHFGEVKDVQWQQNGSRFGRDQQGQWVFEPPPAIRGNIARAAFYMSAQYGVRVDNREENVLRRWSSADMPDAAERMRNDRVSQYQRNRNPFIDDPRLAERVVDF